ncbi:MAG: short-chain dehydrogenase, partial [Phycisphaeraceae bacterium]|nr:short-chain dehydrogenase [Phycisphaeraceae bacterium]
GADVAIVDLDANSAESAAERIRSLGVRALAVRADVTSADDVTAMVRTVCDQWGRLDVAINNAGIANTAPAESLEESAWDDVLDVNLKGVFLCCRAEAADMLEKGRGSIINVASMSARIVNRPQQHAHYNASKAAVVQMTRTCAAEWALRGVRANTLSPGHMDTSMTADMNDEAKSTWRGNTPMGRIGAPDDLKGAAVYLASDASSYVTGHDLVVDGGYTIW